jgi:transcriptional regulator with XRE-family HTH domain
MKLGKAIKILRKQTGISQTALSELTGISQTSLSKIETGTKPSESNLKKICSALDVPPSLIYLLGIEETDVPKNKVERYRLLFPVIKNLALQIVDINQEDITPETTKHIVRKK